MRICIISGTFYAITAQPQRTGFSRLVLISGTGSLAACPAGSLRSSFAAGRVYGIITIGAGQTTAITARSSASGISAVAIRSAAAASRNNNAVGILRAADANIRGVIDCQLAVRRLFSGHNIKNLSGTDFQNALDAPALAAGIV